MATPQFLTKNPNFLHEAFLDIYTADPRWLRLSDNFYENHDGLLNRAFPIMPKSETHKIYENFIEHCKKIDPFLTAIKLIHMDINGKSDKIYAIGWVLATLTEIHYSKKICKNLSETNYLKITLTNNVSTFKFLNTTKYTTTLELIKFLLQF